MLDTSPENLGMEVAAAVRYMGRFLSGTDEIRRIYTSPAYDSNASRGKAKYATYPVNHPYEWLSLKLPQLCFGNPRWTVRSRRSTPYHKNQAEAIRAGLNRWSVDVGFGNVVESIVPDMGIGLGIGMVTRDVAHDVHMPPGAKEHWRQVWGLSPQEPVTPRRPGFQRVPPSMFFIDPAASCWENARYMGHAEVWLKSDLVHWAEAFAGHGWRLEDIRRLDTTSDQRILGRDNSGIPDRGEVVVHNVLVFGEQLEDETRDDEAYNGTIHTLVLGANSSEPAVEIKDPTPFYGPPCGPYVRFGVMPVMDRVVPLGPLTAVSEQVESLNDVRRAIERAGRGYKRFVVADSDVAKKVTEAPNDWVVTIEGFDKSKMAEVSHGGIDQQMLAFLEVLTDNLDRSSGMSDATRGLVSGRGTATEVAEAAQSDDTRSAWTIEKGRQAQGQVGMRAAWYFVHDNRMVFSVGEAGPEGEDYWFVGGPDPNAPEDVRWSDLEIEAEPESTTYVANGQRKRNAMAFIDAAGALAALELQAPQLDTAPLWRHLGDTFGVPFAEDLSDPDVRAKVIGAGAQNPQPKGGFSQGTKAGLGFRFPQPGRGASAPPKPTGPAMGAQLGAQVQQMQGGA